MREITITSILKGFGQKKTLYWGMVLVMFNNLGLALAMALTL